MTKWFQDEPKRPEMPEHLRESLERRRPFPLSYTLAALPQLVEPRLRSEAAEYLRQVEQWKAQREEWEKAQPYSDREHVYETRMFDGEWIYPGLINDDASNAYRDLADAGADEATLRREAATIYEFVRMRRALNTKETEHAERMRAETERLAPPTRKLPETSRLCLVCGNYWHSKHGEECPWCPIGPADRARLGEAVQLTMGHER